MSFEPNWMCFGLALLSCVCVGWACWMLGREHEEKRRDKYTMYPNTDLIKGETSDEEDTTANHL